MSRPLDRQAVDRLVVEHLPATLRLAQRLAGDTDAAEEIVQEALCRVLSRWQSYRGEAAFSTWMMQIVVNVNRDRRRRRRGFEIIADDCCAAQTAEPFEQASASEMNDMIRAAIEGLPDRQREVALLYFGEGLNAGEMAYILQITEANVHTCLHLARKRIAKEIGVKYSGRT